MILPVKEYIEDNNNDLFTSVITLTEMIKFLHQKVEDPQIIQKIVHEIGIRSLIVPVSEEIAILAGDYRRDDFCGSIADALILATARSGNHKVVTGDPHFKDFPEVTFIEHS